MEKETFDRRNDADSHVLLDARESLVNTLAPYILYQPSDTIHPLRGLDATEYEIPGHPSYGTDRIVFGRSYRAKIMPDVFGVKQELKPLEALSLVWQVRYPSLNRVSVPATIQTIKGTAGYVKFISTEPLHAKNYFLEHDSMEMPDHSYPSFLQRRVDLIGGQFAAYKLLRGEIVDVEGKAVEDIYDLASYWPQKSEGGGSIDTRDVLMRLRSSMFRLCSESTVTYLVAKNHVDPEDLSVFYSAAASAIVRSHVQQAENSSTRRKIRVAKYFFQPFATSHLTEECGERPRVSFKPLLPGASVGVFAPELLLYAHENLIDIAGPSGVSVDLDSLSATLLDMYQYCCKSLASAAESTLDGTIIPGSAKYADMKAITPIFRDTLKAMKEKGALRVDDQAIQYFLGNDENLSLRDSTIANINRVPKESTYGQYLRAAQRFLDVLYIPIAHRLYAQARDLTGMNVKDNGLGRAGGFASLHEYSNVLAHSFAGGSRKAKYFRAKSNKDGGWRN